MPDAQSLVNLVAVDVQADRWENVLARENEILGCTDPSARAQLVFWLGIAKYERPRTALDYAGAIHCLQLSTELAADDPDLLCRSMVQLARVLACTGHWAEARHHYQRWVANHTCWPAHGEAYLPMVQYGIGYCYRYEGQLSRAATWYLAASLEWEEQGNQEWALRARCALARVFSLLRNTEETRRVLPGPDEGSAECQVYRAVAWAVLLYVERDLPAAREAAMAAFEQFAHYPGLDTWEEAELHLLLAKVEQESGETESAEQWARAAVDFLHLSPRHDLSTAARLLLEYERGEVRAG